MEVGEISKKLYESWLKWIGRAMGRGMCGDEIGCIREEKERKTEAKTDSHYRYLTKKGLSGKDAQDQGAWRRLIGVTNPQRKWEKMQMKKTRQLPRLSRCIYNN